MSTSTTNYSLIKPDFSEASGPEELAENMILTERALINLELGSNTGRQNKNMNGFYRNVSDAAVSLNTEGASDNMTWTNILDTSAFTNHYEVDGMWGPPSLGLSLNYNSGNFEFYHAGYYKVTWNLRLQMSTTTATEGFIRAALVGTDGYAAYSTDLGVIGSPIVVALNTMTDLTDIGTEQLIKVVQSERTDVDGKYNYLVTGKNQQVYYENTGFFRYLAIAFAHNNTGSATATPLLNESYMNMEFIRGL